MDSVKNNGHGCWLITLDNNTFNTLREAVGYLMKQEIVDSDREAMDYITGITEPPNTAPTYIDFLSEKE